MPIYFVLSIKGAPFLSVTSWVEVTPQSYTGRGALL
jgi:hypothetical protein